MVKKSYQSIDFNQSYLTWCTKKEKSTGRFSLDSSCYIRKIKTEYLEDFYLASLVMAGNVYANNNLAKNPAYSFQIAASKKHYQIFRDYALCKENSDTFGKCSDIFHNITISKEEKFFDVVTDTEQLVKLVKKHVMLNTQIQFTVDGYQFLLDFPVKHINIHHKKDKFQIETGPILVPQCSFFNKKPLKEHLLFNTAFVFINNLSQVEFLLKEKYWDGQVYTPFFSEVKKINCKTTLLSLM